MPNPLRRAGPPAPGGRIGSTLLLKTGLPRPSGTERDLPGRNYSQYTGVANTVQTSPKCSGYCTGLAWVRPLHRKIRKRGFRYVLSPLPRVRCLPCVARPERKPVHSSAAYTRRISRGELGPAAEDTSQRAREFATDNPPNGRSACIEKWSRFPFRAWPELSQWRLLHTLALVDAIITEIGIVTL